MGHPAKYPAEFRHEAVELVRSSGRSIADVARSLGISDVTLGAWLKADKERKEDPDALSEVERQELKRLRKEVTDLRQDREILRKAAAYFARETLR